MYTVKIKASSNKAARAILDRIYAKYDVLFTEDMEAVTGAALTAKIVLDEGYDDVHPVEQKTFRRTVCISSNYYSDYTLDQLAEQVKGRGTVVTE